MENTNQRLTFKKKERLSSRKLIEDLFRLGSTIYIAPFKAIVLSIDDQPEAVNRVLISVPKKYLKLAVERNRMKRLIREAYRINKLILTKKLNNPAKSYLIGFIYTGHSVIDYEKTEKVIKKLLEAIPET